MNIITGPNGSGKSSLTRAIRSLFWPGIPTGAPFSVEARFQDEAIVWQAAREDGRPARWWRDGEEHPAPTVPGEPLQRCYEMGILDLVLPSGGEVERQLAAIINREISGGVDLVATARTLFPDRRTLATRRQRNWQEARRLLTERQQEQRRLAAEERQLTELRRQSAAGRQAADHLPWWRDFVQHAEAAERMGTLQVRLASFPAAMDRVHADDAQTLSRLQREQAANRHAQEEAADRLQQARAAMLEQNGPEADLESVARYCEALATLEQRRGNTAAERVRAEARLEQARRDLAPGQDREIGTPAAEAYDQLARAFARLAEREGRKEGLDNLLQWPEWETDPRAEGAAARRDHLRSLLLLTPPDRGPVPWLPGLFWLSGLVALIALGGGVWEILDGRWTLGAILVVAGLAGLGNLGGAEGKRRKNRSAHAARQGEILSAAQAAGLNLDQDASPAEIARLLEEQIALLSTTATRDQWRAFLEGRRRALETDTREATEALARLRRDHGLALEPADPDLLNLLQALPRYRAARDEAAALAAEEQQQQEERDRLLARLGAELAPFGEDAPPDLAKAQAALQRARRKVELFRERQ
ncbi:MAG: hypothetical protein CSA66_05985, partial [Proteobacteria bacterium]